MTTRRKLLVLAAMLLCAASFGLADEFNFAFAGQENNISGIFVTTPQDNGQFLITDILNGQVDGVPITSVLPLDSYEVNDNLLFYPGDPEFFDSDGVAFTDKNGVKYDLYFFFVYNLLSDHGIDDNGDMSVAPVPEPGSILLMSTSLLGVAAAFSRKLKR